MIDLTQDLVANSGAASVSEVATQETGAHQGLSVEDSEPPALQPVTHSWETGDRCQALYSKDQT